MQHGKSIVKTNLTKTNTIKINTIKINTISKLEYSNDTMLLVIQN
jgi:hypothetical protein